uniref:SLC13 family permease n=1 Tax=uncultured Polaribacter sp. TaxID=174711 RepID=UPI0026266297|nr:SLC13 family permease [uncultured Polaribacter sp.]
MLIILFITIVLFVWGKYSPDVVALVSMLSLFLVGILTLEETLSGFSNPTVIMIASLFIIGEGLSQTGWTALAGKKLISLAKNSVPKLLIIITLGSGVLSGFVSNTGTVATLLPATISSAWSIGTMPSKILIPVAFGSNTGGLLTLTGTPPNIIVNNSLIEAGYDGFSFFEFALIGLPLLIIAILYFRFIGFKLLPKNKTNNKPINIDSTLHEWIEAYKIENDYYRLRIRSISPLINTKINEWDLENEYQINIVRLKRRHPNRLKGTQPFIELPEKDTELRYHDIITVKGTTESINKLMITFRLGLLPKESAKSELRHNLINQEVGMSEVLVTPKSFLIGRKIKIQEYFKRYGVQVLATSRNRKPFIDEEIRVNSGDSFIIRGPWENIEKLKNNHKNVVVVGRPEELLKDVDELTGKSFIALVALLIMIVLLVVKAVPGAIAALISAGIVLFSGCVPFSKAYKSISFTSVVMIAAMIPMGLAIQKTGAAEMISNSLISVLGKENPILLIGGIFILTTTFSQFINNSATAVLMAPIVLLAANKLNISPEPVLITIAISASTAFLTPIGTTTNAMVMSSGGYKFMDYFKVGFPLLIIFLITTLLLVPIIWPF